MIESSVAENNRSDAYLAALLCVTAIAGRAVVWAGFRANPPFAAPTGDPQHYMQLAHALWAGRLPPGGFFTSPAYPALLALHYAAFGTDHLTWIRVTQVAMASAAAALTFLACRAAHIGRIPALIPAFILALNGPLSLYSISVLPAAPALLTSALSCVALLRYPKRRAWVLVAGLSFGLTCSLRPNTIPALLIATLLLALLLKGRWPAFVAAAGVPVLGFSILASAGAHRPVFLAENGPTNFALGNGPGATGLFAPSLGRNVWEQRRDKQAESWPLAINAAWASAREDPARFARLYALKIALVVNHDDAPLNMNYNYLQRHAVVLRLPWPSLGLLVALALVGLPVALRTALPHLHFAAVVCAALLGSVVIFFVAGEYRTVALPWLAVLAAAGCQRVGRARGAPLGERATVIVLIAAGAALAFSPAVPRFCATSALNYATSSAMLGKRDEWASAMADAEQCENADGR